MFVLTELGFARMIFLGEFEDIAAAQEPLDIGAGVKVHPAHRRDQTAVR
jgi:hypothetical protein